MSLVAAFSLLLVGTGALCLAHLSLMWETGPYWRERKASPWRVGAGLLVSIGLAFRARRRRSLSISGTAVAVVMGFVLTLASTTHILLLLAFFLSGSALTRYKKAAKARLSGEKVVGEGERNWAQVVANGGVPLLISFVSIMESGFGITRSLSLRPEHWAGTALDLRFAAAVAAVAGDTFASELGSAIGTGQPRLITNFRPVPRGTNGGVSILGTAASLGGGLLIGLVWLVSVLILSPETRLASQWPLLPLGGIFGVFGSGVDSLLGALLQFSGKDEKGRIVEKSGKGVTWIAGAEVLSNDGVNLMAAIVTAISAPSIALAILPHLISLP